MQLYIWQTFTTERIKNWKGVEARYVVSTRVLELEQGFYDASFFHFFVIQIIFGSRALDQCDDEMIRRLLQFFMNHGMDLESRVVGPEETMLLLFAAVHTKISVTCLRVFLEQGADLTATDFMGRGPLHNVFRKGWSPFRVSERAKTFLQHEKLVLLLRAGCSVHAVDRYGKTPGDLARKRRREHVWMSALKEAGISDVEAVDSTLPQVSYS